MNICSFFVILVLGLASAQEFTFDSNSEGWVSNRNQWRWSDRASQDTLFPGDNDGFVLLDTNGGSDELFFRGIETPEGGSVSVTFFGRAAYSGANTFYIQKTHTSLNDVTNLIDLSSYLEPYADTWNTVTVPLEADSEEYFIGFFCYNSEAASAGEYFQGCSIDSITITYANSETTTQRVTTEEPAQITTEDSVDVTTEDSVEVTTEDVADVTTEDYVDATTEDVVDVTTEDFVDATTVDYVDVTTEDYVDATTEDVVDATTEDHVDATTEYAVDATTEDYVDATTEDAVDATTEDYVDATTEALVDATTADYVDFTTEDFVDSTTEDSAETTTLVTSEYSYDFQSGTDGWTFSHMNGGLWRRVEAESDSQITVGAPSAGPYVIQIIPEEVYSGTVLAQSPIYIATASTLEVRIKFWMEGSTEYPAHLKVRRRISYTEFDEDPIINLGPYGDQSNSDYIEYEGSLENMVIGEEFTLNIEGSLGANSRDNKVVVSEISVAGVSEIDVPESDVYDFESGLAGWTSGNMDGGKFVVTGWEETGYALGLPKPVSGDKYLFVDRFDIHSGVISIETPTFRVIPGTTKDINLKFWTRGSVVYPVALRFRLKTEGGYYADLPFLNLEQYGDAEHQAWVSLETSYQITLPVDIGFFQIIIEADLGGDLDNLVAVDDIEIKTVFFG